MKFIKKRSRRSSKRNETRKSTITPPKKKERVTFDDCDTIHVIDCHDPTETWYSNDEDNEFQTRANEICRLLQDHGDPDVVELLFDGEDTIRGLEFATRGHIREERYVQAARAVFSTQEFFQEKGRNNTDKSTAAIAQKYSKCCEDSKLEALSLAKDDSKFVTGRIQTNQTTTTPTSHQRGQRMQPRRFMRSSLLGRQTTSRSFKIHNKLH